MIGAETISGPVWHRLRLRTLLMPATLVMLGWGMLAVTAIETNARLVHLLMSVPMIAGGWAEARTRLDEFPRRYADWLIVPGLVLASLETAIFHLSGGWSNPVVITHVDLALIALAVAALRLYQSAEPQSQLRGLLLSGAVAAIGGSLWIDAVFQ
jgi:hypothetical protein